MDWSRFQQAVREGCVDPWAASVHWKDSPSPPPAPDYAGAAQAQGAANVETARAQARLGNPDIYNPYGTQVTRPGYRIDPSTGNWYQTGNQDDVAMGQWLSPAGQELFNLSNSSKVGLGNLANRGISQVQGAMGKPFDFNGPALRESLSGGDFLGGPRQLTYGAPDLNPQFTGENDPVTQAIIQRNQPFMDRQKSMTETQLTNQGIPLGSEAWKNAQDDLTRNQNDFKLAAIEAGARQQQALFGERLANANLGLSGQQQAFGQQAQGFQQTNQAMQARLAQEQAAGQFQNQARQQAMQEEAYRRGLPLNEVTALMSGSQVQTPQFQPYQGAAIAPPPIFGAAQAQAGYNQGLYNQQVGQQNALTSGLFGLGGMLGAAGVMKYGFPWMA